jgi:putative membrane protein
MLRYPLRALHVSLAVLSGAALLSGQVVAQSAPSSSSSTDSTKASSAMSKADQNSMKKVAQGNLAEIEAGKLALERSQNDSVKTFAQKMVDEHTKAQDELQQLAQAKGVQLPTEPDLTHRTRNKAMSALKGDAFDKQYLSRGGMNDHRDAHNLVQKIQQSATDPDLKALAGKMAPTIDQHLAEARELSSVKSTSSGSSAGMPSSRSSSGSSSSGTSSGMSK